LRTHPIDSEEGASYQAQYCYEQQHCHADWFLLLLWRRAVRRTAIPDRTWDTASYIFALLLSLKLS